MWQAFPRRKKQAKKKLRGSDKCTSVAFGVRERVGLRSGLALLTWLGLARYQVTGDSLDYLVWARYNIYFPYDGSHCTSVRSLSLRRKHARYGVYEGRGNDTLTLAPVFPCFSRARYQGPHATVPLPLRLHANASIRRSAAERQ